MPTMHVPDFKARCLTILKRGRPVAEIQPPSPTDTAYPQQALKGTVTVLGDIVGPALPEEHWDSLRR